nr:hypothetical protein CFP56_43938 [Quercus suber]
METTWSSITERTGIEEQGRRPPAFRIYRLEVQRLLDLIVGFRAVGASRIQYPDESVLKPRLLDNRRPRQIICPGMTDTARNTLVSKTPATLNKVICDQTTRSAGEKDKRKTQYSYIRIKLRQNLATHAVRFEFRPLKPLLFKRFNLRSEQTSNASYVRHFHS